MMILLKIYYNTFLSFSNILWCMFTLKKNARQSLDDNTTEAGASAEQGVKTIENHKNSLHSKTNSKNTVSLVMYAIKNKIVNL